MKKILITGANSYIGNAVESALTAAGHQVFVLDMKDGGWREFDFSVYDSVFHVAGIVHETKKKKDAALYYSVNRDLAVETAQKARAVGVNQFVFMSSMSIYNGLKDKNITAQTLPKAKDCYGDSKLQADLSLQQMNCESFKTAIIRPPIIFGKGCKGNFPSLVKLASKLPLFPKVKNRRSMLHIENLCEIIKLIVEQESVGIFFPQNPDYFCSSDLVKCIAAAKGKKVRLTKILNWLLWLVYPFFGKLKKLFGSLTYDMELSDHFEGAYQITDNQKSVEKSI